MPPVAASLVFLAVLALLWPLSGCRPGGPGARWPPGPGPLQRALQRLGWEGAAGPGGSGGVRLPPLFQLAAALPVGWAIGLCRSLEAGVGRRLAAAGLDGVAPRELLRARLGLPLLTLAAFAGPWVRDPGAFTAGIGLAAAALAWLAPEQWLGARVRARRRAVERDLPAVLTTLAVTTEAGLSLTAAMAEVARRRQGALAAEFARALAEVQLGCPQAQALERMAARCAVPDLTLFLAALVQGCEKGGGGVAAGLREQAAAAWAQRRRRAEELAQQASVRLFLPLVLLVFPALLLFLIGPAALTVAQFFLRGQP